MSHDVLDLDTAQQLRHAARNLAQNAEIMYGALLDADLPERVVEKAFLEWWRITLTPQVEFPDISKMFPGMKGDDDE